ncbi:PD40 domain-containing protein [Sandaracinus amylolyticus]|uniref:Outer membrane protein OmpA family n=1 Tax=Sandaracinus amylolyticus TaxID=927083 RepID=A0A0F6YK87_9BACT|nr:PD40 domain-containing protein [Sandaracinus amylolyticus]AKF09001.1 Outer membrane protein OmpA family [Sandaracinus amylolyticus]
MTAVVLAVGCGKLGYEPQEDERCTAELALVGPVPGVNVVGTDDWAPFVTNDGLALYFASWRAGGAGSSDLWVARRSDVRSAFGAAELVAGVNDADFQSAPALGPDGTLYFLAHSPHVTSEFDVWSATPGGGTTFVAPDSLGDLSANGSETDVELSRDGLTAFVASWRGGGESSNLWIATRPALDEPFEPLERIDELNTTYAESSMTISPDGLELVFASDRPGGAGGLDLWIARRPSVHAPFGEPLNLTALNSTSDDSKPSFSPDGATLYFNHAADEDGGDDADIWLATRCAPR